ncbi:TspO/MBR family protein [Luteibaculum oceani]|uniref:Tryptophan-rich sensory protein n=1 Tax=Luteibaculum oceani TaxID=1294296 RepID=A0A5C6VIB4_9FLAO|nr:TspO/MBR family protein [Luteibaculum oceani]TXC85252.1 tryptophan-rich sensory protein [Luteibaculum oceani]
MWKTYFIFLFINFSGLAIGSFFTGAEVMSSWYINLEKAPWTPPGWVFGAAWTTIMIFFSATCAAAWHAVPGKSQFLKLFIPAWTFNVLWNFVFFGIHLPLWGLVDLLVLFILLCLIWRQVASVQPWAKLALLPYGIWMLLAISLNAYILVYN